MMPATVTELLQWVNVLLIPIVAYLIRIETRLTKMETMQSAEYQFLIGRHRSTNGANKLEGN